MKRNAMLLFLSTINAIVVRGDDEYCGDVVIATPPSHPMNREGAEAIIHAAGAEDGHFYADKHASLKGIGEMDKARERSGDIGIWRLYSTGTKVHNLEETDPREEEVAEASMAHNMEEGLHYGDYGYEDPWGGFDRFEGKDIHSTMFAGALTEPFNLEDLEESGIEFAGSSFQLRALKGQATVASRFPKCPLANCGGYAMKFSAFGAHVDDQKVMDDHTGIFTAVSNALRGVTCGAGEGSYYDSCEAPDTMKLTICTEGCVYGVASVTLSRVGKLGWKLTREIEFGFGDFDFDEAYYRYEEGEDDGGSEYGY